MKSESNCTLCENRGKTHGHFSHLKDDMVAGFGELVATVLFLLFAFCALQTVNSNVPANNAQSVGTSPQGSDAARLFGFYYISAGFGLSLAATASIFYRFTGSIMNPSVSLALVLVGVIRPVRFIFVSFAQMVGGIFAALICDGLTPGPLSVNVALDKGTNRTQGLFLEVFGTAILTLAVLMLAAEKHRLTPMAPLFFGFILFVVEMGTVPFTGGAINTARAFGPAVVSRQFRSYHWIYWLGPTLGALLATAVYYILKKVNYARITPGQDSENSRDAPKV